MRAPTRCPEHTAERIRRMSAASHADPEYRARRREYCRVKSEPRRQMLANRPCGECGAPVGSHFAVPGKDGVLRCRACLGARHRERNRLKRREQRADPAYRSKVRAREAEKRADSAYRERQNALSRAPHRVAKKRARQYGLDVSQLDALYAFQSSCCWTCGMPETSPRLSIHHDHNCCAGSGSCGSCVVALLCRDCNRRAESFEHLLGSDYPLDGQRASAFATLFGERWADLFGPMERRPKSQVDRPMVFTFAA